MGEKTLFVLTEALTDDPGYKLFYDVIDAIAEEKVTVEQESFPERKLLF